MIPQYGDQRGDSADLEYVTSDLCLRNVCSVELVISHLKYKVMFLNLWRLNSDEECQENTGKRQS
jgi:hypothetical protein